MLNVKVCHAFYFRVSSIFYKHLLGILGKVKQFYCGMMCIMVYVQLHFHVTIFPYFSLESWISFSSMQEKSTHLIWLRINMCCILGWDEHYVCALNCLLLDEYQEFDLDICLLLGYFGHYLRKQIFQVPSLVHWCSSLFFKISNSSNFMKMAKSSILFWCYLQIGSYSAACSYHSFGFGRKGPSITGHR